MGQRRYLPCVRRAPRQLHRLPCHLHRLRARRGNPRPFRHRLSTARRSRRGQNRRLSLLCGILRERHWLGAGGRVGSRQESGQARVLLRRARREPRGAQQGPRCHPGSQATGRSVELFRISVRRTGWRQIHKRRHQLLVQRSAAMTAAGTMKLLLRFAAAAGLALALTPLVAPQARPAHQTPPAEGEVQLPNGKSQQDEILKADHERDLKDATQLIELAEQLKQELRRILQVPFVTQLIELAEQLKQELEKNDRHVLSLSSLKKTEEIEKLAKRIRSRLVH